MAITTEIAPTIYRISIFAQWGNFQFNHFLAKGDDMDRPVFPGWVSFMRRRVSQARVAFQLSFDRDLCSCSSFNARPSSVLITACRLMFNLAARSSRSRSMP